MILSSSKLQLILFYQSKILALLGIRFELSNNTNNSKMKHKKLKLWELERISEKDFKSQQKFPVILILNDIRSLNNIGSFFRTADAFNVEKIYLCGITASPPHREIQKTALGATKTVEWEYRKSIVELIQELKSSEITICSIEQATNTLKLNEIDELSENHFALVFGNEIDGVDQAIIDLSDYVVEVPQFGTKHSINVAVCGGIVIWEFAKRFF